MLHRVYRIRYPPLIEVGTSLSRYKGTPFLSSITVLNVMVGIVVDAVSEISAAEKMKAMQEKYKDNTSLEKEIDEIKKHLEVMESLMDAQKARN